MKTPLIAHPGKNLSETAEIKQCRNMVRLISALRASVYGKFNLPEKLKGGSEKIDPPC
jgi:hypothetical protein